MPRHIASVGARAAGAEGKTKRTCDPVEASWRLDEARRLINAARMAAGSLEDDDDRQPIQKVLEVALDEIDAAHNCLGLDILGGEGSSDV